MHQSRNMFQLGAIVQGLRSTMLLLSAESTRCAENDASQIPDFHAGTREHALRVARARMCFFVFECICFFRDPFQVHGGDPDSSSILPVLVARAKYPNQWNVLEGVKVEGGNQTM